jgi:hypothetical protein
VIIYAMLILAVIYIIAKKETRYTVYFRKEVCSFLPYVLRI